MDKYTHETPAIGQPPEVDGEMLESFGALLAFAQNKRSGT